MKAPNGGALKPIDVDPLWVHVTCDGFQPEVSFLSDEMMEPTIGILRIPSATFIKVCVICKKMHGSCTQCYKCSTYYHAMCASRAGCRMEKKVASVKKKKSSNKDMDAATRAGAIKATKKESDKHKAEDEVEKDTSKPKPKNPLDMLPPSKMVLDEWKRMY